MERHCEHCGKAIIAAATGRPKRFCGQRCRKASNRALGVPRRLRSADRWIRHYKKRPLTVTGRAASVTAPSTWSSFTAAKASTAGHGLGFVLGDGVGCLDFDHCFTNGVLDPKVATLVESLPATWMEISPSGDGLHVWGLIPEDHGRVLYRDGVKVERYSTGRYITITGKRYGNGPRELADLSETLSW
ncbi:DNA primase [Actinomycetaceae bacterium WB03_NA08]|uniref:DNA primase n=1 Tax=Scrofimicrobium canadense TaxID=2652290 RepID=A0A6N7VRY8_9ACTO|nr:DNA primase [Scrofimicrobium canadense]MSS84547.1 DNA primase [Scrofimicrobium canadense]